MNTYMHVHMYKHTCVYSVPVTSQGSPNSAADCSTDGRSAAAAAVARFESIVKWSAVIRKWYSSHAIDSRA